MSRSAKFLVFAYLFAMISAHVQAAPSKIKDPVAHAFNLASQSNEVADCEREDDGKVTLVSCVSEIFETDMPCPDPSSPSGLEMCFGVEVVETCDFEFKKVGKSFELVSGPDCDTVKADER